MIRGEFYKHPNNTTVCIEVVKYFLVPTTDDAEVTILWHRWHLGKLGYHLGIMETFRKPVTYWKEWRRLYAP